MINETGGHMLVGYYRISTRDQNSELQEIALKKAGCNKMFSDVASGSNTERSGLQDAIEFLRKDDVLVVWRLDRLGRSLKDLINTINVLDTNGIGFKSLQENMDTTTSGGRLVFHVFAALAEFEKEIIRERTYAGLEAARARGKHGGRPTKMDERKIVMAKNLHRDPQYSIEEICKTLKISRSTLYRHLQVA